MLRQQHELGVEVELVVLRQRVNDVAYLPVHLEPVLVLDVDGLAVELRVQLAHKIRVHKSRLLHELPPALLEPLVLVDPVLLFFGDPLFFVLDVDRHEHFHEVRLLDLSLQPPHLVQHDIGELEVMARLQLHIDRVEPVPEVWLRHPVGDLPDCDFLPVHLGPFLLSGSCKSSDVAHLQGMCHLFQEVARPCRNLQLELRGPVRDAGLRHRELLL